MLAGMMIPMLYGMLLQQRIILLGQSKFYLKVQVLKMEVILSGLLMQMVFALLTPVGLLMLKATSDGYESVFNMDFNNNGIID